MINFYAILEVPTSATRTDIKKSFKRLARANHPDRGGNEEHMKRINDAYEILSDSKKRAHYDQSYRAFQDSDVDQAENLPNAGLLPAGPTRAYSHDFKCMHAAFIKKYSITPLKETTKKSDNQMHQSQLYQFNNTSYATLFTLISAKNTLSQENPLKVFHHKCSPPIAIGLFIEFLEGAYFGNNLNALLHFFNQSLRHTNASLPSGESALYEGLRDIIAYACTVNNNSNPGVLISALVKITECAKNASPQMLDLILPLFYNKYYRDLHACILSYHWTIKEGLFYSERLALFNGVEPLKKLLTQLREQLVNNSSNENAYDSVIFIKLLYNFEKQVQVTTLQSAAEYRQRAFHLLDWIPSLVERCTLPLIANVFFQIGLKFQLASKFESDDLFRMADEQLALTMYYTAASFAHRSSPDVETYINSLVIQYVSSFRFEAPMQNQALQDLKKRTLIVADIFPLFNDMQSNVSWFKKEKDTLLLMRTLLTKMIAIHEYNKTHSKTKAIVLDHKASSLLYQAYEACLKNWYSELYDAETEKKFRLELMDELLFDEGWTFFDVEENLNSPWIMADRDQDGWFDLSRYLPFTQEEDKQSYREITGAEVNNETGDITLFLVPWDKSRPPNEKVMTAYDIQDMLERNLGSAFFSLDPVDPSKPYHPFNAMRYAPKQLAESELFNTMLLTDYLLKFLTTGQEVQGEYPFAERPADSLIKHLPMYLRKIVEHFRKARHSEHLHRFWIEAVEVDVALDDAIGPKKDTTRIGVDNIKMVVKKHRMERDIHGELQDVSNDEEGWPIYVVTEKQMLEIQQGKRRIDGHAMIFIYRHIQMYFWEHNDVICSHKPTDFNDTLIRLYLQAKNDDGKVTETIANAQLRYRIIKTMARQTSMAHRLSPEFIFAHKFTTHYDEFALHLPEFGRLKELSKLSVLVRFLGGIYQSNQDSIHAIEYLIKPHGKQPESSVFTHYQKNHLAAQKNICDAFAEFSVEYSDSTLQRKWQVKLNALYNDLGTLDFNSYSPEFIAVRDAYRDNLRRANPKAYNYQISEAVEKEEQNLLNMMSRQKKEACVKQLRQVFSEVLNPIASYISDIERFVDGWDTCLLASLVKMEKGRGIEHIAAQFPIIKEMDITRAIEHPTHSIVSSIALVIVNKQFSELKDELECKNSGFKQIEFAKLESYQAPADACMWVPASVNHEVKKDAASGLTRYSFFVYGGVNVQARANIVNGNGALRGNSVGWNGQSRQQITRGFQDHHIASPTNRFTKNHQLFRLAGISQESRINKIYLPAQAENHASRSIHRGRHTTSYSARVGREMDKIVKTGILNGWDKNQYKTATKEFLSEMKQQFKSGTIGLNKNIRPNSTKW